VASSSTRMHLRTVMWRWKYRSCSSRMVRVVSGVAVEEEVADSHPTAGVESEAEEPLK